MILILIFLICLGGVLCQKTMQKKEYMIWLLKYKILNPAGSLKLCIGQWVSCYFLYWPHGHYVIFLSHGYNQWKYEDEEKTNYMVGFI